MIYLVYAVLEIDRPACTIQVTADSDVDARCKVLAKYPLAVLYTVKPTKVVNIRNVIHVDFKNKKVIKRTA